MKRALVGHTGFVGSNLLRQADFDDLYHSRNIEAIAGRRYDLVVCAGAPAEKWKANQDPVADRTNLLRLMMALAQVQTRRLILISTVDVHGEPRGVDEASPIDPARATPYGRHRRALEVFLAHRFPTLIVRLPGLFGPGLKKNVLYDLLHNNGVDRVQPDSQFQFYGLDHLWSDVTLAMKCQIPVLHAATAPLTVAEIAHRCFGRDLPKAMEPSPVRYDFRSGFCELFGGSNGYLYGREEVLAEIKRFVATNREARYATSGV